MMYERYATGTESYGTIATWLNDQGLRGRRGKSWSKDTVREVLLNATYAGYLSPKRGSIDGAVHGKFEALVNEQIWNQVRSIRERRNKRRQGTRPTKREYVLSGLATCGRCGGRLHGISTGRKHNYARYACSNRVKRHSCDQPFARAWELDDEVAEFVSTFALDDRDLRIDVLKRVDAIWLEATAANRVPTEHVEQRLARLKDLYELGDIERDEYLQRRSELSSRLAPSQPAPNINRDRCVQLLSEWPSVWVTEDAAMRREYLRVAFDRIVAEDGGSS